MDQNQQLQITNPLSKLKIPSQVLIIKRACKPLPNICKMSEEEMFNLLKISSQILNLYELIYLECEIDWENLPDDQQQCKFIGFFDRSKLNKTNGACEFDWSSPEEDINKKLPNLLDLAGSICVLDISLLKFWESTQLPDSCNKATMTTLFTLADTFSFKLDLYVNSFQWKVVDLIITPNSNKFEIDGETRNIADIQTFEKKNSVDGSLFILFHLFLLRLKNFGLLLCWK